MAVVAVTGGTGSIGRGLGPVVLDALRLHGHRAINLDVVAPPKTDADFRQVDLTSYGDTFAALYGVEAIVHLAAQVAPEFDHISGASRFHTNTISAYNVFQAATTLGISKVVWASSETVLGFPFERNPPKVLPLDDDVAVEPQLSYAFSKAVLEDLARHMHACFGTSFVGLRFSHIYYDQPGHPTGYEKIPQYWTDLRSRSSNLWAYVDARDVASAVVGAVGRDIAGTVTMIISAADTIMRQTNEELVSAVFPAATLSPILGPHETLISIKKARRLVGYHPRHSWRDIPDIARQARSAA